MDTLLDDESDVAPTVVDPESGDDASDVAPMVVDPESGDDDGDDDVDDDDSVGDGVLVDRFGVDDFTLSRVVFAGAGFDLLEHIDALPTTGRICQGCVWRGCLYFQDWNHD